ncbi:histidine phosphatase family protein [Paenibacillus sp. HJGM_3]|uniref:histidine phosphatase family protein n=1 Tax=Paenibacillus sp. HJGM_3 TaxID=3379816 RepID=UPI00385F7D40
MTRYYLMRHGETDWNRDRNRYCGRSDIGLSEQGIRQAEQTALYLKAVGFDRIFASGLQRAVDTARPIAALHRLEVERDDRLTEADFGRWEGLRHAEIVERYPESWRSWYADPSSTQAGMTGETAIQVFQRMNGFFEEQTRRYPDENILVVSHSTAIRLYLAGVLSMTLRSYRQLVLSNVGITVLEAAEGTIRLLQFNNRYDALGPVNP